MMDANAADAHPPPIPERPSRDLTLQRADIVAPLPRSSSPWRTRLNELFVGITSMLVVVAALVCLADAIQDSLKWFFQLPVMGSVLAVVNAFYTSALIALLLLFGVVAALNRYPRPDLRQPIAIGVAVIVAAALGTWLKLYWFDLLDWKPQVNGDFYTSTAMFFTQRFVRYLAIGALVGASFTMYRRQRLRIDALHQTELDQANLGQQLDEARLQALLAQIEPHFLFNTLANVRSLYQSDPSAAAQMLDNLTRYLTVALPRMRESDSTIGREAALAEAYLGIQQIRMGARLAFSIDVPADLQHAPLPPMMLLTLVENAIKHGLGQLKEGGTITIKATHGGGQLSLQVADTGRGFSKHLGNGAVLANIRARLGALHGASARLRLAVNAPRGVIATIVVPFSAIEQH